MESGQAVVLQNTTPLSEVTWDSWMDFIWREYIMKNRRIEDVFNTLQRVDPQVKYAQLRAKLKEWGFHKNLTSEDWRYVDYSIGQRKSQGKDSIIILSGKRVSQEKVKSQTDRHKVVRWGPSSIPKSPQEKVPLYVCTPRPTTATGSEWPKSLPWLKFSEDRLPELMSGLRLLPISETPATTESTSQARRTRKRRRLDASFAWTSLEKLVRRSMEIVVGSEELTRALLLSKSVDRLASRLDEVIPGTSDENLRRAVVLSGGSRFSTQKEVLKILLYLVSNHLFMDMIYRGSEAKTKRCYMEDARALVDMFRLSGLTTPHILAQIVKISLDSLTMTAVVDMLYEAAVNTEAVDLVLQLLSTDRRIDINRLAGRNWWRHIISSSLDCRWSALESSLIGGSPEIAKQMLRAGATADFPLALATLASQDTVAIQLVQLLLGKDIEIDEDHSELALLLAVMKGNRHLIDLIHAAGADLSGTRSFRGIFLKFFRHRRNPTLFLPSLSDYVTCLGLAASFSKGWFDDPFIPHINDQHIALSLVKHILMLGGPEFDIDGKLKSDAMIFAAMRGYTEVISFLYHNGARVNSKNGFLCPVYAALNWNQVEACQLLLELGGSAKAEYRHQRDFEGGTPVQLSPLHIAVSYESCALVKLLIQNGADANLPGKVDYRVGPVGAHRIGASISDLVGQFWDRRKSEGLGIVTPLEMAMAFSLWEITSLLINPTATLRSDYLFRAVSAGQHQLVSRLLELKVDPNMTIKENESALETSIRNGYELITFQLIGSGATIGRQTLGLALQYGQHQTAMSLLETGAELTGPELAWAFRIPDESRLRSILQCRVLEMFAYKRSPDGRSYLENSILSNNISVIKYALSLDAQMYDSGALCAAVLAAIQTSSMDEILQEIMRRRKLVNRQGLYFDRVLENTAVSIAAYYQRIDILGQLGKRDEHNTNIAALPEQPLWGWQATARLRLPESGTYVTNKNWSTYNDMSVLATEYCSISPPALAKWNNWHCSSRCLSSPLLLAIQSKNEHVIEALLDLGYQADGFSLNAAICHNISSGLTRRIIKGCTDINAACTFSLVYPRTPINAAVRLGRLDLIEVLLNGGSNPNSGPWYLRHDTIGELIWRGASDLIDMLFRFGIDVKDRPPFTTTSTPLQYAAAKGHLGIMRRLLKGGVDPNARRPILGGYTAIEAAASSGRLDAVQLLLDCGVTTEGRGQFQYIFAVHLAKEVGYSAITHLLQSYRQWTRDDWNVLQELEQLKVNTSHTFVTHQSEYTENEMAGLRAYMDDLKELDWRSLVIIGARATGERNAVSFREFLDMNSNGSVIGNQGSTTNEVGALANIRDEAGSSATEKQEAEGLLGLWTDVQTDLENPKGSCANINIPLGPRDVAEEGKEKNQQILDDILGVKEAPFQAIEWAW